MSKPGLRGVLERYDEMMPTLPPLEQRISWHEAREWLVKASKADLTAVRQPDESALRALLNDLPAGDFTPNDADYMVHRLAQMDFEDEKHEQRWTTAEGVRCFQLAQRIRALLDTLAEQNPHRR